MQPHYIKCFALSLCINAHLYFCAFTSSRHYPTFTPCHLAHLFLLFLCLFFPPGLHLWDQMPLGALKSSITSLLNAPMLQNQVGRGSVPNEVLILQHLDNLHPTAKRTLGYLTLDVGMGVLAWDFLPKELFLVAVWSCTNPLHYVPEWGGPAVPGGLPGHQYGALVLVLHIHSQWWWEGCKERRWHGEL